MLRDIWVLVFFVGAKSVKTFGPKNADDGAKDIRLFDIDVDQIGGFFLDVFNRLLNVNELEVFW